MPYKPIVAKMSTIQIQDSFVTNIADLPLIVLLQ